VKKNTRLLSLDFYRGLIMVLLMLEAAGLYRHIIAITEPSSFLQSLAVQFTHHPWHGLTFWDLVQPGFMFIAGTAMAFSLTKQTSKGRPWNQQAIRAIKRSGWLLFWGVFIYAVSKDGLSFQLWNVLAQLSFTLMVAFLIFRWKPGYQILFSLGLLLLTEMLYRFTQIPGFDQPFTDQHNFGNYMDLILMNKISSGGWVAINALPTAAHTIWGAVAGKWLLTKPKIRDKMIYIIIFGVLVLIIGYVLDGFGITPIIKHISTSSFTLVTGGWCLLALAFLYYWIDVLQHRRFLSFFTIVGMNSIFIYLFFEIVVRHWLYDYSNTIVSGVLSPLGIPSAAILIVAAVTLFFLQWYLCYWLYKKKIFFKV
jgi:predicted acyltransferase